MSPERWQQIHSLFDKARSYASGEVAGFLESACNGDEELRREVEWMLAHQQAAKGFIQAPAIELVALSVAGDRSASLARPALGPYEDLRLIGTGGMGEVYSARDPRLKRSIALKVLPEEMAVDPERYARFEREAHAVAALNHPNIVTIHSVEQAEGVHFLTMELVAGKTLAEMILPRGMAVDQIFQIAIPIADAISAAHSQGITHRDLKPTNIMVSRDGRVKVLDFGLAKLSVGEVANDITSLPAKPLTRDGRILGTVSYMSPEQAEGKKVDPRSDIFSLGIILYELATGERPFKGETRVSVLSSIMKDTPRPVTEINPALPLEVWTHPPAVLGERSCPSLPDCHRSAKRTGRVEAGSLRRARKGRRPAIARWTAAQMENGDGGRIGSAAPVHCSISLASHSRNSAGSTDSPGDRSTVTTARARVCFRLSGWQQGGV